MKILLNQLISRLFQIFQLKIGLLYLLILLNSFSAISAELDADGKRNYYMDNYEPGPHETLPPELDPTVLYWPNQLVESRFMEDGKVYIHSLEQDPPNAFWVHIYDSRSQLYDSSELDIKVATGVWDDTANLIPDRKKTITVEIKPGWNKVKINMHQYKAQMISVHLGGLRTKTKILAIEFKGAS